MAEIIKVSADEMRETATQYVSAQAALQEAYDNMDRAVRVLDSAWKGEAYVAMRTQWNLTYKNISTANERMQDAIDELNASANLFENNEMKIVNAVQSLDVGTSPFD